MFELETNHVTLYDTKIEVKQDPEDDDERAIDLDFNLEGTNDLLTLLSGSLKSSLYRKPDPKDQPQMEMVEDPNYMPVKKFPDMKPFNWGYKGEGYELEILSDLDQSIILQFADVSVKNINVDPKEGGTVKIKFRCRVHPTEKQVGRIYSLTKQTFPVNLIPPSPADEETGLLDDEAAA